MAVNPDFRDYAFISVGANLPSSAGNPLDSIRFAFERLAQLSTSPLLASSVYVTSPVGSPAGTPDFFNAMAGIVPAPDESPLSLLHKLQAIENDAGRTRSGIKNEARALDLDLITFRREILDTDELILPHPRAHERRFVLEPLIEITHSGFLIPGLEIPLIKLLKQVSQEQKIRKL